MATKSIERTPALGQESLAAAFNNINTNLSAGSYITFLTAAGLTDPAANLWYWTAAQRTALKGELRTNLGNDQLGPVARWPVLPGTGTNTDYSASPTQLSERWRKPRCWNQGMPSTRTWNNTPIVRTARSGGYASAMTA